jgi:hypothetical protein
MCSIRQIQAARKSKATGRKSRSRYAVSRPRQDGLKIEGWQDTQDPKLDGKPIESHTIARSLAIDPDGRRFVLGADWSLSAFDAEGKPLWQRLATGTAWAVNITRDGRLAVAAYSDGTIRWYSMDDGRELLALQVLSDKNSWVAWTPEGFYAATPSAYGVLQWHVNRGADAAGETLPVSQIPKLKRPDALPLVLQEMETARALGIADLAAARADVRLATGAAKSPGARLHVLTIGISDYGDKATNLALKYAAKDASDVANALLNTQRSEYNKLGGLYAEVNPIYLADQYADKDGIFKAFARCEAIWLRTARAKTWRLLCFPVMGRSLMTGFIFCPTGLTPEHQLSLERLRRVSRLAYAVITPICALAGLRSTAGAF